MTMKSWSCAIGTILIGLSSGAVCQAAELIILTNQGATPGVSELAAAFERASGHKVTSSRKRARRSSRDSTAARQT